MKNALHYYYGLEIDDIHQKNSMYFFKLANKNYVFIMVDNSEAELEIIYKISKLMLQRKIYCHEIILNSLEQIITVINGKQYVLMRTLVKTDETVILGDVIYFQNSTKYLANKINYPKNNWYNLWTHKIDYFEYQVNQLSKKYPIIRESFSYYVGLAEISIELFKLLEKKDYWNLTICHKRNHFNDTLFDLYNPLNFIVDIPSRDGAEYFKTAFIERSDIINEIIYYLKYSDLSEYECQMFFVRLLFPTFYFDLYEDVITDQIREKELLKIVTHVDDYDILIRQVYKYLRNIIYLPDIECLIVDN